MRSLTLALLGAGCSGPETKPLGPRERDDAATTMDAKTVDAREASSRRARCTELGVRLQADIDAARFCERDADCEVYRSLAGACSIALNRSEFDARGIRESARAFDRGCEHRRNRCVHRTLAATCVGGRCVIASHD